MADINKIKLPSGSEYNLKDYRIPGVDTTPTSGSDNVITSGGVRSAIDTAIGSVYRVKGTKATYAELPSSGNVAGDVWNVTAAYGNYPAGTNWVWTGSAWDALGGEIDLSGKQDVLTFDSTPTANSTNPITSGGVYASNYAGSTSNGGPANMTVSIPFAKPDSTSTSTVYTVQVPGITELRGGVCFYLMNDKVTSAANFTININDLGAKPVYLTTAAATRATTQMTKDYTWLLVYNETRYSDGCWDLVYTFNTNTTYTLNYLLDGSPWYVQHTLYRYQLMFQVDEKTVTPLNGNSNSTGTSKTIHTDYEFDPFGKIFYYTTTSTVSANTTVGSSYCAFVRSAVDLRYTFNVSTSVNPLSLDYSPVYIKININPTTGMATLNSELPLTQTLPTTNDEIYYLYLGRSTSTKYTCSLEAHHPIYYHNGSTLCELLPNDTLNGIEDKLGSQLSGKEDTSNKVTSISSSSTDTQYPSARTVYEKLITIPCQGPQSDDLSEATAQDFNVPSHSELIALVNDGFTPVLEVMCDTVQYYFRLVSAEYDWLYFHCVTVYVIYQLEIYNDGNSGTGVDFTAFSKPNPGTLNTTATTAQSTSSSEALSGDITLHKVAKTGTYSDLIGTPTIPDNVWKWGEGQARCVVVNSSKAGTTAGYDSFSEGYLCDTGGSATSNTKTANASNVVGSCSHAEGNATIAKGLSCHSEGKLTFAGGEGSHAEGIKTHSGGHASHTEGEETKTNNVGEHAGGRYNSSTRTSSTYGNAGNTSFSHGIGTADNARKNALEIMENGDTYLYGVGSYDGTNYSVASTLQTVIGNIPAAVTESTVSGWGFTKNSGTLTGISFNGTAATVTNGVAAISATIPEELWESGTGTRTLVSKASDSCTVTGARSVVVSGYQVNISGAYSHGEGTNCTCVGNYAHVEGDGTIANNNYEHAQGTFNVSNTGDSDSDKTLHSIGCANFPNRANAVEVMKNGDVYIKGIGSYDGTNYSSASTLQSVVNNASPNNSTITIQMNGSTVDSFTTNAASAKTIDLGTVITSHQDISGKANVATTLSGYGITDATISGQTVTLGSNSVTVPQILSGTSDPASSLGNNGDIYIKLSS